MEPVDLERFVDRELKALPQPRAPRTLLPRVMAAVALSRSLPWYSRAWVTWPRFWQAASVVALALLVAGGVQMLPVVNAVATMVLANAALPTPAWVSVAIDWAKPLWDAGHIMWRVMVTPVLSYVVAFVLLMSAACVLFGTALNRVALGGASEL
jgi:hypothetical protein